MSRDTLENDAPELNSTPPLHLRKYLGRLVPLVVLWLGVLIWISWLLLARANWIRETDDADIREWLDETRTFRKSLPELVREYDALLREAEVNPSLETEKRLKIKHDETVEHLRAMAEPTRVYPNKLPLFPEVYAIVVEVPGRTPPPSREAHPSWRSPVTRPGGADDQFRTLEYSPYGKQDRSAIIHCEYRVHTFNTFQRERHATRTNQLIGLGVLVVASMLVVVLVFRVLRRERLQELLQWRATIAAEHNDRELLETRVKQQEALRATEELSRKLLEQELEAAQLASRASEAERSALELKSQLYASIGIMAGSYAHNIKNLLVRPNDLLTRCMETNDLNSNQHGMLQEVKLTLGTVTERLQQILRTIRRDPNKAEVTRINLADLITETSRTWSAIAWEKWKVRLTAEATDEPLVVNGDLSHLQQAIENLIFNARDATFEMRNYQREEARRSAGLDAGVRKQKLIEAASWKGKIELRTIREDGFARLEVRDNGIGMTEDVRRNCMTTHFTTKRDNALYEGYNAGMGLGLSFVAVVLEHHGATLEIESSPLHGALFRVRIPLNHAEPETAE